MLSQWLEYCATDTKAISSSLIHVYYILIVYICDNNTIKVFTNRDMFVEGLHFDCKSNIWGSIPPCLFFYFTPTSLMVEPDTSNILVQVQVLGRNYYTYKNNIFI